MKYIRYDNLDEKILYDKLNNGLEVFIMRKEDFNTYEARFFTNFGGIDTEFNDKKMPSGIAHFLEHKLFEQESGENVHDFYDKSGTYVNAFTNYEKTCFYISGINNFKDNLNYLLDFVQQPFFTDENVEKEKGIIKEEALMGFDNPNRVLMEHVINNLFTEIPYNNTVVGTLNDIESITKEKLYDCYNTFYHPSNMKLFVVSNLDEKEVLNIIKNNQNRKKFNDFKDIKRKDYNERDNVKLDYEVIDSYINEKRLCYSIKINRKNINYSDVEIYDSIIIYLTYIIGSLSKFNLKLKKDKIIKSNISYSVEFIKNKSNKYVLIHIYSITDYVDKFIKLLEKEITKYKCSEKDFIRLKKIISSEIFYSFNSIDGIMKFLYNDYCFNDELNPKNLEIEKKLDYNIFLEIIKKISLNNKTIVVLNPKNN